MKKVNAFLNWLGKHEKVILLIAEILTFIMIFGDINRTEYHGDDLVYQCIYPTNERVNSFHDIYVSQYTHYFIWGGRTVVHSILQLLLWIDKPYNSMICAFIYVLLARLIAKALNQDQKVCLTDYLLSAGLLYYCNPVYEETVTWMTGFANYAIGAFIVLLSLYLDRNMDKHPKAVNFLNIPLTFLAGWCNENLGAVLGLYYLIRWIRSFRKKKERAYSTVLLLAEGAGFLFMILAPGNFARSTVASSELTPLTSVLTRIYNICHSIFHINFQVFTIATVLLYLNKDQESRKDQKMFYGMAVLSVLAMFATPYYPDRAGFGSMVLLLVSIMKGVHGNRQTDDLVLLIGVILFVRFTMNLLPSLILTILGLR